MTAGPVVRRLALVAVLAVSVAASAGRWWAASAAAVGVIWALRARHRPAQVDQGPRDVPFDMRRDVLERWGGRCAYCGRVVHVVECEPESCPLDYQCDHVVAYSKGGPTRPENLVAACRDDNQSKGDREVSEWYRERFGRELPWQIVRV